MPPVVSQKVYTRSVSAIPLYAHIFIMFAVFAVLAVYKTYLPLSGEVPISGGNAKQEAVILDEGLGIFEEGDIAILGGGVHLGEDLVGQSLGELVDVDLSASSLGTLLLGLGELLDVAVHGVLVRTFDVSKREVLTMQLMTCLAN